MEDTMDQAQEANRKRISDLLNTLKMEPDVMKLDLEGKAISRSETSLHLAGASGIMARGLNGATDDARSGDGKQIKLPGTLRRRRWVGRETYG
jgi:hypothetical protein